ncbi:methyltranfer_dom domain-containing protein [Trichonephila clavipes]|nr:methyltranfer_dom domain-containing protein [Trichonephila clavipes]
MATGSFVTQNYSRSQSEVSRDLHNCWRNIISFRTIFLRIANEWSFDESIHEMFGCQVFSFDPSMGIGDHRHGDGIMFYNMGVGEFDGKILVAMSSRRSATEDLSCRGANEGRGSLVVKITDSWLACNKFEPCAAEEPPCVLNMSRLNPPHLV